MSNPMDMTWIWHGYYHTRYIFWQNVISMSYACQISDTSIFGYTWHILNIQKNSFGIYQVNLFMSYATTMSYPCHKFVRLSCSGQQMKFSRILHCGSSSAYRCTAFIKNNKIYLPQPRARTPPLPQARAGFGWGLRPCWLLRAGGPS